MVPALGKSENELGIGSLDQDMSAQLKIYFFFFFGMGSAGGPSIKKKCKSRCLKQLLIHCVIAYMYVCCLYISSKFVRKLFRYSTEGQAIASRFSH